MIAFMGIIGLIRRIVCPDAKPMKSGMAANASAGPDSRSSRAPAQNAQTASPTKTAQNVSATPQISSSTHQPGNVKLAKPTPRIPMMIQNVSVSLGSMLKEIPVFRVASLMNSLILRVVSVSVLMDF